MRLEFITKEEDYIQYQLFTASKSKRLQKKQKMGWMFLTFGGLLATLYYSYNKEWFGAIYFALLTLVFFFLYNSYFKWRHRRVYTRHIRHNYANRIGVKEIIEINDDHIYMNDKTGEGKIFINEIEEINEIADYFFIKISTGMSLIIPKNSKSDTIALKEIFKSKNLKITEELDWSWYKK